LRVVYHTPCANGDSLLAEVLKIHARSRGRASRTGVTAREQDIVIYLSI
jgi:hypothetical protein